MTAAAERQGYLLSSEKRRSVSRWEGEVRRKVALYLEDVQFHSRSQASSQSVEVMSLFPVRKLPEDSVKPVSQGQRNVPRQHNLCFLSPADVCQEKKVGR